MRKILSRINRCSLAVTVFVVLLLQPMVVGTSQNLILQVGSGGSTSLSSTKVSGEAAPLSPPESSGSNKPETLLAKSQLTTADPVGLDVGSGQPFATIQAAVNAANDSDTIIVHDGTYNEMVTILNKTLTLMNYGADVPLVNGTGAAPCFNVTSNVYNDITITGFNITGGSVDGVYVNGTADVNVTGNTIYTDDTGIYLDNVFGTAHLNGNTITAPGGILVNVTYGDLQVNGNSIDSIYGVNIETEYAQADVSGNNITSLEFGIGVDAVWGGIQVNGNNITSYDSVGIGVAYSAGYAIVNQNTVDSSADDSIEVIQADSFVQVDGNTLSSGSIAIDVTCYGGANVEGNDIVQCVLGGVSATVSGPAYVGYNFINSTGPGAVKGVLLTSRGAVVENNTVYAAGEGIEVMNSYSDVGIYNNTVNVNGVDVIGIEVSTLHGNLEVQQNVIHDLIANVGILIHGVYGRGTVLGNVVDAHFNLGIRVDQFVGSLMIAQNTLYNVSSIGIWLTSTVATSTGVKNNIVVGTDASGTIGVQGGTSGNFTNGVGFNDIYNCNLASGTYSPANGDMSADPMFLNVTAGDYRLNSTSPCVDAGTDIGLPYTGLAPDMGAFESPAGLLGLLQDLKSEILALPDSAFTFSTFFSPSAMRSLFLYCVDTAIAHVESGDHLQAMVFLGSLKYLFLTRHWLYDQYGSILTAKINNIASQL